MHMSKLDVNLKKQLAALQDLWAAGAAEPKRGQQDLPDGQYKGKITAAELGISKKERLQVVWGILVTEGPCKGMAVKRFSGMQTKENMAWLNGDLLSLGLNVDAEDINSLAIALEEAVGLAILFKVRSKDEFTNIDFQGRLTEEAPAEEAQEEIAPKAAKPDKTSVAKEVPAADDSAIPTKAQVKLMKGKKLRELAVDAGVDPADCDDDDKKIANAIVEALGL
jgi:hypothetical protein